MEIGSAALPLGGELRLSADYTDRTLTVCEANDLKKRRLSSTVNPKVFFELKGGTDSGGSVPLISFAEWWSVRSA
jgi:hypothetical protein